MEIRKTKDGLKVLANMYLLIVLLLVSACGTADENEHTHDHGESEVHAHDEGIRIDTTVWTEDVELFVEYPVMVTGERIEFIIHLTRLDPYQAVSKGSLTVNLLKGQSGIRQTVDTVAETGIFRPALIPEEAGNYQLYFELDVPGVRQRVDLGKVRVFASHEAAQEGMTESESAPGDIEYSKEKAWKMPFAISPAIRDSMTEVISLVGKWMPDPGSQRVLNAPAAGNVLYAVPNLLEGMPVQKGVHLMTVSSREMNVENMQSEIYEAKARFELGGTVLERKEELHQLDVISDAEWQEVKKDFQIAQSRYTQLVQNYSGDGVELRAPISGYIKSVYVENGDYAPAGNPLLRMGTTGSQLLKVHMNPAYRQSAGKGVPVKVFMHSQKNDMLEAFEGKIISVGKSVNEDQPLLPVVIEVLNEGDVMEGSMAKAEFSIGALQEVISIPTSALLENFGKYSVVVQKSGERFEIRPVTLGMRTAERVQITSGLEKGEMVVSKGAYQVKMASMSASVPAHGHTH